MGGTSRRKGGHFSTGPPSATALLTDGGKTTERLLLMYDVIIFIDPNRYFELFLNQNDFLTIIKLDILLLNNFFDVAIKTKIANLPWHLILKHKEQQQILHQYGVVYEISRNCGSSYIGQTSRNLTTRPSTMPQNTNVTRHLTDNPNHFFVSTTPLSWSELTICENY